MWILTDPSILNTFIILLFQIPLSRAHYQRKEKPNIDTIHPTTSPVPTTTELCLLALVFWSCKSIGTVGIGFVHDDFPEFGFAGRDGVILSTVEGMIVPFVATWMLHFLLVAAVEFMFPAACAAYLYPLSTLQYAILRTSNLLVFIFSPSIDDPPPARTRTAGFGNPNPKPRTQLSTRPPPSVRRTTSPATSSTKHQRTRSQSLPIASSTGPNNGNLIRLERTHSPPHISGPRVLDWNLVIDALALNEMKETLGPPGGFGELGFCVQKDGVKFECMGPGTCFSLSFNLAGEGEGVILVDETSNGNGNLVGDEKGERGLNVSNGSGSVGKTKRKKR